MTDVSGSSLPRRSWKSALDVVTSLVLIGAAVMLVYLNWRTPNAGRSELKPPTEPISIATAASRGEQTAPTVLVVYSDFQCPFCGRFARDTLPALKQEFIDSGRVQLVYHHLPIESHPYALGAAKAAECARRQDSFWALHDRMFERGAKLDESGIREMGLAAGLDSAKFEACLAETSVAAAVQRDLDEAKALGLSSTPSFLLGTRLKDGRVQVSQVFAGALPLDQFRAALQRASDPDASRPFWKKLFS